MKNQHQVSIRLDGKHAAMFADLVRWAENEELALADFCRKLLRQAALDYERSGSLQALRMGKKRAVSELTHEQLYTALDAILERAPATVVEKVAEFLIDRAGKYAESKHP